MQNKELYKILDRHVHGIVKIIGEILREKAEYNKKVDQHIKDLSQARAEILELAEKLD